MPDTTLDPQAIAKAVAIEVADEDNQVGDFVEAIDLGDDVTDFRFETRVRGYEGWQWSVTLYHDVELDHWTVNESSLVPTDKALRPPAPSRMILAWKRAFVRRTPVKAPRPRRPRCLKRLRRPRRMSKMRLRNSNCPAGMC